MTDKKRDRDKLLALLLAAYLLSQKDIARVTLAIATGYLVSMQAAYREAAATVGSDGTEWEPSQAEEDTAHMWAQEQAQGIAETYARDLTSAINTYLESYQEESGGSLVGASAHAGKVIGDWCKERASWKSEQMSNSSCGSGGDAGISKFLVDLTNGQFVDTETGEAVKMEDYAIAVLPEQAGCPTCKTYAGLLWDIQDTLPEFPLHTSCGHERVLMMV